MCGSRAVYLEYFVKVGGMIRKSADTGSGQDPVGYCTDKVSWMQALGRVIQLGCFNYLPILSHFING